MQGGRHGHVVRCNRRTVVALFDGLVYRRATFRVGTLFAEILLVLQSWVGAGCGMEYGDAASSCSSLFEPFASLMYGACSNCTL